MNIEVLFDTLSDEDIERSLTEHKAKVEALSRELAKRETAKKKEDWAKVEQAIRYFSAKYGYFYVSINDDDDYSIKDFPFKFDKVGTINIETY